jgi:acetyl esterase/lipase
MGRQDCFGEQELIMALAIDPQIAAALQRMKAGMGEVRRPAVGDWQTRRESGNAMFRVWAALQPIPTDVVTRDFSVHSHDGKGILLRWFQKSGSRPGSAALYVHGGGMLLGSVDAYDEILKRYVSASGVPLLAVDYRLPPEHPFPTPVEDCYAGLRWFAERSQELGVDPTRIAIMGDSAGGGLAAATALVARDRSGPMLAAQLLVYPMLDDRNTKPDPAIAPLLTWNWDDNITGWGALLGDGAGKDGVDPHAAPARASDLTKLPPSYIEVGQLDIFRDESVAYAQRLQPRVPTELHVHPGAPHGFELFAPDADVSRRAIADRVRALQSI